MSDKFRVAIVAPGLAPYRIPVLNRLNDLPGVSITVLLGHTHASKDYVPYIWNFPYLQFQSFDVPYDNGLVGDTRLVTSPGLLAHIARSPYDLVVALGWTMPNTFLVWMLRKWTGRPVALWDDSIPHPPSAFKQRIMPFIKRYIGSFDSYLLASSWSMDYFASLGAARARMVHFPLVTDNDFFARGAATLRAQRHALKQGFNIQTSHVILFVGRFIPVKGIPILFEAFERVAAQNEDVSLLLVGRGSLEEEMCARREASSARERIFIQPFASQQDLPKFYAVADLFVLPSFYETFGAVVVEAMASGLPVVTTSSVGAAADLVRDGENGRVVKPGDSDALASAISQILNNDALRQQMSTCASSRVSNWNIDAAVKGLLDCIQMCLGSITP